MTSCHIIATWHKWNANANDVMMTWFTLYTKPSDVTLGMHNHAHLHDTCALSKSGMSKYLSCLVCIQANPNLVKITASNFGVLNTQNANQNMPKLIPIAYLNENFIDCNENLAWGK